MPRITVESFPRNGECRGPSDRDVLVAATQAAQPDQGTVTAAVTQTVGGAVAQLAQAINQLESNLN